MKQHFSALLLMVAAAEMQAQSNFYDINTIQEIDLHFYDANWDARLDSLIAANSDARILADVTINGVAFDSVGVKYKGNSSHSPGNAKNPFNIKLDYTIGSQDYQGHQTLKLSNAFKDPSFVREALGYEIAREYLPSPQANFARVYVDGVYHGLFTNVESVNGDFLSTHYWNDAGAHFKCDPVSMSPLPVGCINGGSALEYLGSDTACYYQRYEIESDYGWGYLRALTDALKNNPAQIEQFLDVDRALWMCAFNNVLVNLDSYLGSGHNYYIYQDNNYRFNTIIWDCNETFGTFSNVGGGTQLSVAQMQNLSSLYNQTQISRPLLNKLLANPRYKKTYIAHLRTIVEEYFSSNEYLNRAQTMQTLIDAAVQADVNKFFTYADFSNNINNQVGSVPGITQLMVTRTNYLENTDAETVKVPPTIANVQASNNTPFVGDLIYITAQIGNANAYKLRYRDWRFAIFQETDLFDDGAHGDGAAGDGVYGAQVQVPATGLQYYIYAENNDAAMFSPVRAEYEFYELTASSQNTIAAGDLVINEIMASNLTAYADQDGEYDDWIEIYNTTSNPISLQDIFLTDNLGNTNKWAFPDTTIAANGYLIVWADNDTFQTGLHAYFKLSATGEQVGLYNLNGTVIDSVSYGVQTTDITYGRYVNGTGNFTAMPPTPGAVNSLTVGVNELPMQFAQWRIFPNPSYQGQATLALRMRSDCAAEIQVVDNLGRSLQRQQIQLQAGENQVPIEAMGLSTGMYYVLVWTAEGESIRMKWEVRG